MSGTSIKICLISVHGLVRSRNPELGRDADTGGQVLYVVELAKALALHPQVHQVELITRLIVDESVHPDYSTERERISPGATIVRIPAGPDAYIMKEQLWEHLDVFADNLADYLRADASMPMILHSHYADAGYVGSRLSHRLGIPLIHTGHSLGRVKRRRLLAGGMDSDTIDQRYNMRRRIAAEEQTLAAAASVITSTRQEIHEQYELYDYYRPDAMHIIPPGTDLSRFQPPMGSELESDMAEQLRRFLREPRKPIILALSRADPKKNITNLVHAYGKDQTLQELANLVIIMGNRDAITELDPGARDVFVELLQLIDRYDLYGRVAYPKQHSAEDVPVLYRLATVSRGVFVNPALTEPFGLTLIEAAASALPIVATEDGGPTDIIDKCANGLLVDPLESTSIAQGLKMVLCDKEKWKQRSAAGLEGVRKHYSWAAHAEQYVGMVRDIVTQNPPAISGSTETIEASYIDRALFTNLNRSLLGDKRALGEFIEHVRINRNRMKFGITTELRLDAALKLLKRHAIPVPDFLISSTGTQISFAPKLTEDIAWKRYIEKQWTPDQVKRVMQKIPGISLREDSQQSEYKISYQYDNRIAPNSEQINALLYQEDQAVNVIYSHGMHLSIVPIRASKGLALRYLVSQFNIPLERTLAIGGSGADEDMMRGNTLAAIVGNRSHEELSQVSQSNNIYFAENNFAAGMLEAMDYYDFLGACKAPDARDERVEIQE